jgi:prepilin-type N-terminal cleavage/methylation domain-containing protein
MRALDGLMRALDGLMRAKSGLSLIELMIALAILAGGMLAMLAVQITALQQGRHGRHASEAMQIARDRVEWLTRLPWSAPETQPTGWTAPQTITKTVQSDQGVFQEQTFSLQWRISTAAFDPNVRTIDVRVLWTEADAPPGAPQRRFALSSIKHDDP